MPYNVQARGARFQLRVIDKLLLKPFFFTFDTDVEARSYGDQLTALLARGIVPAELLAKESEGRDDLQLIEIVRAYIKEAPITDSDDDLLGRMLSEVVGVRQSGLTYQWVDQYVQSLKFVRNIAPSSIRKRVGALGRVMDWQLRRTTPQGQQPPANPFRLLPASYSAYTRNEAEKLEGEGEGKAAKRDVQRDRRLLPAEETQIEWALAGGKRDDRERALEVDPAFTLLFRLFLDTGLRLSEGFMLRVAQVDLKRSLLHVDGTKGHRGKLLPRIVPLKPKLAEALRVYCHNRVGLLFPFWDGTTEDRTKCSHRLSVRFSTLFEYAGVNDFSAHDLRHEATCRWVELRNSRDTWAFSETAICKIMGWKNTNMMLRYASLRGEDLVAQML